MNPMVESVKSHQQNKSKIYNPKPQKKKNTHTHTWPTFPELATPHLSVSWIESLLATSEHICCPAKIIAIKIVKKNMAKKRLKTPSEIPGFLPTVRWTPKAYWNSTDQSPEWFYSAFNHPQRLDITYANSNFMQELMIKGSITDGKVSHFWKGFIAGFLPSTVVGWSSHWLSVVKNYTWEPP